MLLLAALAWADPTIDLTPYATWHEGVVAALDGAQASCPAADLRLRLRLRVGPDGVLTDAVGGPPQADLIGPPVTAGFAEAERARALAKAEASRRCFEQAIQALPPMPPPGSRGVVLMPRWFDFGARSAPPAEGLASLRIEAPLLDSDEVRDARMAVLWAGEPDVWACADGYTEVEVAFRVSTSGDVDYVDVVTSLPLPVADCVSDVVRRWTFPSVGVATTSRYRFRR